MKKQTSQLKRGELRDLNKCWFGVVGGRGCVWKFVGYGTEWIRCGCVSRWKDCQRNVFLEPSCVVEMAVFFLTLTAAITAQQTFHPVVIINSGY